MGKDVQATWAVGMRDWSGSLRSLEVGVGIACVQDAYMGLLGLWLVWEFTLCVHGVCLYALTEVCCTFLSVPYV